MNHIISTLLISLCLTGCASLTPVASHNEIPIFTFKIDDPKKFLSEFESLVKDVESQSRDIAALKKSREGLPKGEVDYVFKTQKAVGYTANGEKVEGIILVENIQWKGMYRPEIADGMRETILRRLSNMGKPVYVKEVRLDY